MTDRFECSKTRNEMDYYIERAFSESRADYLEIRIEERSRLNMGYRGRTLEEFSESSSCGGFIRALVRGGWSGASFTDVEQIPLLAKKTEASAGMIGKKASNLAEIEAGVIVDKISPRKNPLEIPMEYKQSMLSRYNSIMLETPGIHSTMNSYSEEFLRKRIFTSEGARIEMESLEMNLIMAAIARRGENIQFSFDQYYSGSDFHDFENLEREIEEIAEKAVKLLDAQPVRSGVYDIVMDPRLCGVFAHEAFGHLSESDFVFQNESLMNIMKIGREFGPEHLNIIDDGSLKGLPGCFSVDDEGVPMKKTWLIREGRLSGRLHNRETAAKMNEELTGNARAVSFLYEPVVRMSCTYIDAGDWKVPEMMRDIDNGYYVVSSKGGQTNLEQFTFSGMEAFRIRDGELTDHIRDLNLSGNLFDTLKNIDGVGDELKLMAGGSCGKGGHFPLSVSYGGPHLRIRNVMVS